MFGIGATIRIRQEMLLLPYAGFLILYVQTRLIFLISVPLLHLLLGHSQSPTQLAPLLAAGKHQSGSNIFISISSHLLTPPLQALSPLEGEGNQGLPYKIQEWTVQNGSRKRFHGLVWECLAGTVSHKYVLICAFTTLELLVEDTVRYARLILAPEEGFG